ncbi:MAG TPA: aldose 1-epimerase [Rhizorhapis sp.]
MTTIDLLAGSLRLRLAPSAGGSITRFDVMHGGIEQPLLRGAEGLPDHALESACFPLVPFSNRIRGGSFTFRDRRISLRPNMTGDPSPLHGQGWLVPWQVEEASSTDAILVYRHEAGEWPWHYEARQEFALGEQGLHATLCCRNVSDRPMPCGLGFHPYFPCSTGTLLQTAVSHVWTIDENVLPVERVAATGRYALDGGTVCGRGLDNGYDGWSGLALISQPDAPFDLCMSSPDASYFQLYSPEEGGLFVAEPVSHANDALGAPEQDWPALGLRVLEAGEEMCLQMRIDLRAR